MRHNLEQVYSDIPFEDAIDRVGGELAAQGWVGSAHAEPGRDWEQISGPDWIDVTSDGDETQGEMPNAGILASPARTLADDYGDVVIRIRDGRWAEERGVLLHGNFPIAIQRDLTGAGSLISVEPSPRYGSLGPFGAELCLQALNSGEAKPRALQRGWQNDLVAVNEQGLTPGINGIAATIDALTEAVTQGQPLPPLSPSVLPPGLTTAVGDLHPHAQLCLRTAEILSPLMVAGLDASSVIVQYTKAVEIELGDLFLQPLRQYWDTRTPPDSVTGQGKLQRLYSFLFHGQHMELGSAAHAIKEALKDSRNGDPVAESAKQILSRLPRPAWARNQLTDELLLLASTARNPATHTAIFSSDDLPRVRRLVLGNALEAGLLEKLLTDE